MRLQDPGPAVNSAVIYCEQAKSPSRQTVALQKKRAEQSRVDFH